MESGLSPLFALCSERARILLPIFLALFLLPAAHALPAQDQGLAANTAEALTKAKAKKVVVFDFMGPDDRLTQLGRDLADGFSRTLANAGRKFTVIDRAEVLGVIEKNRVAPDVIRDSEIAWWLARQLKADALIVGQLTAISGDTLRIAVTAANTKDGNEIVSLSVDGPFTDPMKLNTRLSKSLNLDRKGDWVDSKSPKELIPKCVRCPIPEYSDTAVAQRWEGTVSLIVLVTEDGIAKDIDFVKSVRYGLTQKAIEAVQKWKFQPGQGPDGKPRAVWMAIEVTFHLK
jgi:TonB family protein